MSEPCCPNCEAQYKELLERREAEITRLQKRVEKAESVIRRIAEYPEPSNVLCQQTARSYLYLEDNEAQDTKRDRDDYLYLEERMGGV